MQQVQDNYPKLRVLDHPLAAHLIGQLRSVDTPPDRFRSLCKTLTVLLMLEATRNFPTESLSVKTPICDTQAKRLGQGLAVVPILRAGLGMLESALELFPDVAVGYIGLARDEATALPQGYYSKLPLLAGRMTICLDPMLATGGSASSALSLLKEAGATDPIMVCVVAAPDGVKRLAEDHPDVPIITAALDEGLNDKKYIVPGLGDFGDRLYGTP